MATKKETEKAKPIAQAMLKALRDLEAGTYVPGSLREGESEDGELAREFDSLARAFLHRALQVSLLKKIIAAGFALSAERDFNRLLESVVVEAQEVTGADAGSLYLLEENVLKFVIVRNASLGLAMGGTSGRKISFQPVPLYQPDGSKNYANIASYAAHTRETIRLADAYAAEGFDFSGTRKFDSQTGYRSKSFLVTPLANADGAVIGVLQLINAKDPQTGETIPFEDDETLESLALLAAAALDGYIREEALRREIVQLKIEIDQARRARQVAEVTEADFFQRLKEYAEQMRSRKPRDS